MHSGSKTISRYRNCLNPKCILPPQEDVSCPLCMNYEDLQGHLLLCQELKNIVPENCDILYDDIFGNHVEKSMDVVKVLIECMDARAERIDLNGE